MKKIAFMTATAALVIGALTGCPGKGGKGDQFVTSPNSCLQYSYQPTQPGMPYPNPTTYPGGAYPGGYPGGAYPGGYPAGQYYNPAGQPVNCNPYMYGGANGYFMPAINNACSSWSMYYPDSYYVPMQMATPYGMQMMCVKTSYFYTIPGWNNYYNMYGAYPTYGCMPGMPGCAGASGCLSAGGAGGWGGAQISFCAGI